MENPCYLLNITGTEMTQIVQIEQSVVASNEITSMMTTFEVSDDVGMVMVPLELFLATPTRICDAFQLQRRQISHNEDLVNVFVDNDVIVSSDFGKMNKFSQTWTLNGESEEFLEKVITRLSTQTTVLSLTLHQSKVKGKDTNLNFLVFIKSSSQNMASFIDFLYGIKSEFKSGQKFAAELDLGPAVEKWAGDVLGEEMICIGGRLGVTSGKMFNPIFDWSVVVGILPCLPVTLIASLIYRATRKVRYTEHKVEKEEVTLILGSRSIDNQSQRKALSDLTRAAISVSTVKCGRCGLLLRLDDTAPSCSCPDNRLRCIDQEETALDGEGGNNSDDLTGKIAEFHQITSSGRTESLRSDDNHRNSIGMEKGQARNSITQAEIELNDMPINKSESKPFHSSTTGSQLDSSDALYTSVKRPSHQTPGNQENDSFESHTQALSDTPEQNLHHLQPIQTSTLGSDEEKRSVTQQNLYDSDRLVGGESRLAEW